MPRFPSLEWCEALVKVLEQDPAVLPPLEEWGGRSLGVVVGRDGPLARDFCVYAKPHPTEPRLLALKVCEDEDDLELEEPDYFFRAPFGVVRQVMQKQLDPLEVLRKGRVRVRGDLQFLIVFGQRHQRLGEDAVARVETTFP